MRSSTFGLAGVQRGELACVVVALTEARHQVGGHLAFAGGWLSLELFPPPGQPIRPKRTPLLTRTLSSWVRHSASQPPTGSSASCHSPTPSAGSARTARSSSQPYRRHLSSHEPCTSAAAPSAAWPSSAGTARCSYRVVSVPAILGVHGSDRALDIYPAIVSSGDARTYRNSVSGFARWPAGC